MTIMIIRQTGRPDVMNEKKWWWPHQHIPPGLSDSDGMFDSFIQIKTDWNISMRRQHELIWKSRITENGISKNIELPVNMIWSSTTTTTIIAPENMWYSRLFTTFFRSFPHSHNWTHILHMMCSHKCLLRGFNVCFILNIIMIRWLYFHPKKRSKVIRWGT